MKSESFKSLLTGLNKEPSKDSLKGNLKDLINSKSPTHKNANNLSFDTSLIKCFCKKTPGEAEKTISQMVLIFLYKNILF